MILNIILIAILGTIFGSLGSVLLSRLDVESNRETWKGILFGRSECPDCKHTLSAINLIPIFSRLFQSRKCPYCKSKISPIYITLELFSAGIFVGTFLFFPRANTGELIFWIIINRGLLLLIIYDIQKYELNIGIRFFLITWSIIVQLIINFTMRKYVLGGIIISSILLWCIYIFAKFYVKIRGLKMSEGMGMGDVFMAALLGSVAHYIYSFNSIGINTSSVINLFFMFLFLSSVLGLIYFGINTLITKKQNKIIPFLPAMIVAFWLLLFGFNILIKVL